VASLIDVKVRSSIAAIVVLSLLVHAPSSAHAQEQASPAEPAPVEWAVRAPAPIDLRINGAWPAPSLTHASAGSWFGAKPAPIKLSNGAITAIIIGGIVLVVLVVAGVAVIGKPGKIK
jgi:hypothetical protein